MTATASGAMVPPYPEMPANATVEAHAAGDTLTVADMFKIHTNTGEADGQATTLPTAASCAGCIFRYALTVAQAVTLEPASATEQIYLNGSGVANKHLAIAGAIGNFVDLYSDGVVWHVTQYSGVVTKEA